MKRLETLVVGVDGSPDSDAAVNYAVRLGGQLECRVLFVHALGLTETNADGETVPSSEMLPDLTDHLFGEWTKPARDAEIDHEALFEHGPPTMALERVATRENADLVILGHRGDGSTLGVLGSTTHHMIDQTTVAVLCVQAEADQR